MTDKRRVTSELKDNIIHKSEVNITGDAILEDNIIFKSTINLHVPNDVIDNKHIRSFLENIPFTLEPLQEGEFSIWKLPVDNPEMGKRTLVGIKEAIKIEIRNLKAAHRKTQAKIEINRNKKQLLDENIAKLRDTKPDSRELPRLESTVWIMEQYPEKARLLNEKIEDLTDLLHSVSALQQEDKFRRDLEGTCAAVERLLSDAVKVLSETESIVEELE